MILDHITSQKELKAGLSDLAKEMAKAAKIEDFELGKVEAGKNGNGVSFMGVRGDGKVEDIDFVVMVHAFEAKKVTPVSKNFLVPLPPSSFFALTTSFDLRTSTRSVTSLAPK